MARLRAMKAQRAPLGDGESQSMSKLWNGLFASFTIHPPRTFATCISAVPRAHHQCWKLALLLISNLALGPPC